MACVSPQRNNIPSSPSSHPKTPDGHPTNAEVPTSTPRRKEQQVDEARRGLLKAMWQGSVIPHFSSKPIDVTDEIGAADLDADGSSLSVPSVPASRELSNGSIVMSSPVPQPTSRLTSGERKYLENLLKSEDLKSIRQASRMLENNEVFPPLGETERHNDSIPRHTLAGRRDSKVQQHLFRLHQETDVTPSTLLRRMSSRQANRKLKPENSILRDEKSWDEGDVHDRQVQEPEAPTASPTRALWDPFTDVNSWIDGNEGVEVDGDGIPEVPVLTSNPFKILGTFADDTTCHPHVLSPPLMEGLQGFLPESLLCHNYWLKFSMVRDGPNLRRMLRQVRASANTILAIETTGGEVFGSFTCQPWRLACNGYYYGSRDSFVWRLRHSRKKPTGSVLEQALNESKLDVFPFTYRNTDIQTCSLERLALGSGEIPAPHQAYDGQHYGNAIRLNGTMSSGSTSSSETFGNPCLIDPAKPGKEFEVANVELWALTEHSTPEEAERAELEALFLEEGSTREHSKDNNLNLMEILVGSPRKRIDRF